MNEDKKEEKSGMSDERKKRFSSPGRAWKIVTGPGAGLRLDEYAELKRAGKDPNKVILQVDILSYEVGPAHLMARFWWSEEGGVTCDRPRLLSLLEREGIVLRGSERRVVRPSEGRVFFDALPLYFDSLLRAQKPRVVEKQGGAPPRINRKREPDGVTEKDILQVDILDYQDDPPTVAARFWWSAERGLTCDTPRLVELLKREGIRVPLDRRVYPQDGREFFDALQFGFDGLESAQEPRIVKEQGGEPTA